MRRNLLGCLGVALLACSTTVPGALQNPEGEAIGVANVEVGPPNVNNTQKVTVTMPDAEVYQGTFTMMTQKSINPSVNVDVKVSNTEKTKTSGNFGMKDTSRIVGAKGRLVSNLGNYMDCEVIYVGGTKGLFDVIAESGQEERPAGAVCVGGDGRRLLFQPPDPNTQKPPPAPPPPPPAW